jgi:intein-encoded DNA endonuclease-like protein
MSLNSKKFLAYIAGFLDGDGSIYVRAKPNSAYRHGYQIAPYVAFFQSQTSSQFPDVMAQIEYGRLRVRNDGMYEYTIGKHEELKDFLLKIKPFLHLKKKQADLMLEILELKTQVASAKDFECLLERIEEFRTLNYSKKRIKRTVTP